MGYAAAGLGGGLLAAAVAFAPSFLVVAIGAERFARLRSSPGARAFLDGAGPAAVGAILGAGVVLVDAVRELRGSAAVVVAQQHMQPVSVRGPAPTLPSKDVVHCCVEPAPDQDTALDPPVRAALTAMLADGVSTRTAARALAELTGLPRRRAYDAVLALGARS